MFDRIIMVLLFTLQEVGTCWTLWTLSVTHYSVTQICRFVVHNGSCDQRLCQYLYMHICKLYTYIHICT